jgi:hypothetical protein
MHEVGLVTNNPRHLHFDIRGPDFQNLRPLWVVFEAQRVACIDVHELQRVHQRAQEYEMTWTFKYRVHIRAVELSGDASFTDSIALDVQRLSYRTFRHNVELQAAVRGFFDNSWELALRLRQYELRYVFLLQRVPPK